VKSLGVVKYWVCEIKLLKVVVICVTFLFRLIFLTVVYVRAVQVLYGCCTCLFSIVFEVGVAVIAKTQCFCFSDKIERRVYFFEIILKAYNLGMIQFRFHNHSLSTQYHRKATNTDIKQMISIKNVM